MIDDGADEPVGARTFESRSTDLSRIVEQRMTGLVEMLEGYPDTGRSIGSRMEQDGTLVSMGFAIDGQTKVARSKDTAGSNKVGITTKFDSRGGYGTNELFFGNKFEGTEDDVTDRSRYPAGFPQNPRFMLQIHRHTDSETRQQVDELVAEHPELERSSAFMTTYLVGDGEIGKIVRLPKEVQDNRTPIEHSESGRAVATMLQGGDAELIAGAIHLLEGKLKLPAVTSDKPEEDL
ncbi:MAG TPA: hypothetical protein VLG12_02570 [Candidatus Saccharimonadales bacterium]|nr:hypothetical protein [Candidatus Saccharimonadales bacterium]